MYKAVIFDNKLVHVEGYDSIICLSETLIKIKCKKTILEITGERLMVKGFNSINININGVIKEIKWLKS